MIFYRRQLEHLDSRLTHDISSIFALLRDSTYQYSSLPSSNVHLLGNHEIVQTDHALRQGESAQDTVLLLPGSSDPINTTESPDNILSTKGLTISTPSTVLPAKHRSSSAVNISCQTPHSIQSKRALSTSVGTQDYVPGSQVNLRYAQQTG